MFQLPGHENFVEISQPLITFSVLQYNEFIFGRFST